MGKALITPEGYELLNEELNHLWDIVRPEVAKKVAWAASLGDRSENADYHYNKRLLGQIDRRVRFLRQRLGTLTIVRYSHQQEGRAYFGAYVELQADDNDEIKRIRLVGGDELMGRDNYISIDAPMARALLGKEEGDDAEVVTPARRRVWYINKISYTKPDWFEEQPPQHNALDDVGRDADPAAPAPVSEEERRAIEERYLETLVKKSKR